MSYDYYRRVLCPWCEAGEMRAVNVSLARCSGCQDTMGHGFFDALLRIRSLPEVGSREAPTRSDSHGLGPGSGRWAPARDPYPPECADGGSPNFAS